MPFLTDNADIAAHGPRQYQSPGKAKPVTGAGRIAIRMKPGVSFENQGVMLGIDAGTVVGDVRPQGVVMMFHGDV